MISQGKTVALNRWGGKWNQKCSHMLYFETQCSSCCTTDFQDHPRSIIFMSFESQNVTFYQLLIGNLALSLTISEIRLLIAWNFLLKLRPNRCRWRHSCYWQPIYKRPIWQYNRRPSTTYRFVTIPHDWHTIVRYDFPRSSKANDFHVI